MFTPVKEIQLISKSNLIHFQAIRECISLSLRNQTHEIMIMYIVCGNNNLHYFPQISPEQNIFNGILWFWHKVKIINKNQFGGLFKALVF